jgi:hypothetical protein
MATLLNYCEATGKRSGEEAIFPLQISLYDPSLKNICYMGVHWYKMDFNYNLNNFVWNWYIMGNISLIMHFSTIYATIF